MNTIKEDCPWCGAFNKPNASPAIERTEHGLYVCCSCSKTWVPAPLLKKETPRHAK